MTGLIDTASSFALVLLSVSMVMALYRVVRGPSLPDRIISLDLFASIVVGMLSIHAIRTDEHVYLTAGIALALIAFISTVALALYIRRGAPQ